MMKKPKKMIIANWKMNVTSEKDAESLFLSIKNVVSKLEYTTMVCCPPHMYVNQVARYVDHRNYRVGGQDAYPEESGSRTGETSVLMMKNAGAEYVILGHSERRHLETKSDVARKVTAVLEHDMVPIICIGEEQRDKNWKKTLTQQLRDVFNRVPKKNPENIIIAYEPVWAISGDKKNPATAVEYMEALEVIKKELQKMFKTAKAVDDMRFLYGGSLDDKNIEDFLKNASVDGFLVGRVSHDPRVLMTMFRLIEDHEHRELFGQLDD
ncbi:triosephosphate isomerase [Patescibacteria group bacterium]|nr:triosephosphate isomerase [Patescibacteria group bacterium]